jgi:NDP-sugar pyrophosphorylase family protein
LDAIILSAGRGTRLKSVIGDMPKPAIKFGDHTLLQRLLIELLRLDTVSNIYINVSAGAEVLLSSLRLSKELPRVRILYEVIPWGPSLTVFETLKLSDEGLLVVHGDLLLESESLSSFVSEITKCGSDKSIVAVHKRRSLNSSQEVIVNEVGLVDEILWKDPSKLVVTNTHGNKERIVLVDSGVYFFTPSSINVLANPPLNTGISSTLLPQLINKNLLKAKLWQGMRFAIDNEKKLELAKEAFRASPEKFRL